MFTSLLDQVLDLVSLDKCIMADYSLMFSRIQEEKDGIQLNSYIHGFLNLYFEV